jgi:rhamnosyl/mannosyltransferase
MRDVPATLVLVGDGPEERGLRTLAREVGVEARVVFAGPVDDTELLAWLAAADVGVLPSTLPSEALGIVLIEMLACGVPAVSTELGTGTSFVNLHGETGLVVPPADPEALAAGLNQLLADEPLRRRMGSQGRIRARSLFSREAMMLGVSNAYERAMGNRAGRKW